MKANELRIGNWLIDKRLGKNLQFTSFYGLTNVETWPEDFEPIPLTPEILEKAGFEKRHDDDVLKDYKLYPIYVKFQHNDGLLITIHEYSSCSHIHYLHELQNLFHSLCGEELDIKL